jgi:hypothetical protein
METTVRVHTETVWDTNPVLYLGLYYVNLARRIYRNSR